VISLTQYSAAKTTKMASEGSDHPKEKKQNQCKDNGDQHGAGATEPVGEKEEHGTPVAINAYVFPPLCRRSETLQLPSLFRGRMTDAQPAGYARPSMSTVAGRRFPR
jgi:hypothetical protein